MLPSLNSSSNRPSGEVWLPLPSLMLFFYVFYRRNSVRFHVCFKRTDRGEALDKNQRGAKE